MASDTPPNAGDSGANPIVADDEDNTSSLPMASDTTPNLDDSGASPIEADDKDDTLASSLPMASDTPPDAADPEAADPDASPIMADREDNITSSLPTASITPRDAVDPGASPVVDEKDDTRNLPMASGTTPHAVDSDASPVADGEDDTRSVPTPSDTTPNPMCSGADPIMADQENVDSEPPPREALHKRPDLHDEILKKAKNHNDPLLRPVEIRASGITTGSGLFTTVPFEAGTEIFHVYGATTAIAGDNDAFCHYCHECDTQELLGGRPPGSTPQTKACSGCKVVRFCSKQCQRTSWALFHKEECKILRDAPNTTTHHLLAYRMISWCQRGFIDEKLWNGLWCLEAHLEKISRDPNRTIETYKQATAIVAAVEGKMDVGVPWRLIHMVHANCVPLRPPSKNEFVGHGFHAALAMMNHSCVPNAFVFLDGLKLRIRSLRKITAGEEITICYVDPTLDVAARKALLMQEHFFECTCGRCTFELEEQRALLGSSNLTDLHQAQREMRTLIDRAVWASARTPGAYPNYDDLAIVETRLRTIMDEALPPGKSWPEHMEPLPSARLTLAMLYLQQGQPVPALRNALKGKFLSTRTTKGPVWVNEMVDLFAALVVAGSLPPDHPAFEDKTFPPGEDFRAMAYRYLSLIWDAANSAFGSRVSYSCAIGEIMVAMGHKKVGPALSSEEFAEEFKLAQRRVFAWAGLPELWAL